MTDTFAGELAELFRNALRQAPISAAVHADEPHDHVSVVLLVHGTTGPSELLVDPRLSFAERVALAENVARRLVRDATTLDPR
jgi:hypothetical protein